MKKIFLVFIATVITCLAYAQQDGRAPQTAPHIRSERKELKRERIADHGIKHDLRIRNEKRELHRPRNGNHHELNQKHPNRPVKKGVPHRRKPMMDHKRK